VSVARLLFRLVQSHSRLARAAIGRMWSRSLCDAKRRQARLRLAPDLPSIIRMREGNSPLAAVLPDGLHGEDREESGTGE